MAKDRLKDLSELLSAYLDGELEESARPEPRSNRFADDERDRRVGPIGDIKRTALDQPNTENLEEIGQHVVTLYVE